jgi:hypothetical protein
MLWFFVRVLRQFDTVGRSSGSGRAWYAPRAEGEAVVVAVLPHDAEDLQKSQLDLCPGFRALARLVMFVVATDGHR